MRSLIFLPLLFLTSGPTFAQMDGLTLTTKITDQKYCGTDYSDMALLRISLKLTYRNETSKTLILYKGSNLISYILIAADAPQIRARQYEMNMHVGWVTSGEKLRDPKLVSTIEKKTITLQKRYDELLEVHQDEAMPNKAMHPTAT